MESEEFTLEKLDLHERGPLHEPSQSGCLRPSQIDGDVVSCGDVIHGPMEPITAAAPSINVFGKDFEVEFEVVPEKAGDHGEVMEKGIYEVQADKDNLRLQDLYHAGLWAPHPEHYLQSGLDLDTEISVFSSLKRTMEVVAHSGDGEMFVYKKVIEKGCGVPLNNGQIVVVHYAAFVDYADEPVDVAFSRAMKRSLKIQLGRGNALPGFEISLKSMCQGEQSYFIVSPSLAYGMRGCPPRYPGNAEVFYFIEMVSALANDPVELVMQAPLEEREQLDFRAICKVVASCVKRVEVYYRESDFRRAQASQRWTIDLLEHCHTANEKQDLQRNKLLLAAFSNAAVIARRSGLPKAVLYYTGNALRMDKHHRKTLFLRILAQLELKSFNEALSLCKKAQEAYPDSETFAGLVKRVYTEIEKEDQKEKEMYRRMFSQPSEKCEAPLPEIATPSEKEKRVSSDRYQRIETLLTAFKNGTSSELTLDAKVFSIEELQVWDELAPKLCVDFETHCNSDDEVLIRLWK